MKSRIAKLSVALIVLTMLAANAAHAATWKLSHVRPQGTAIDKDLTQFAADLKANSDGKMKAKIYAASSLGDYTVVQERVGLGAIDMACQPIATASDKRMQVPYFPYLFSSWEQAKKNYAPGAPLRTTISELYANLGIRVVGVWPAYFGGIALKNLPETPCDPAAAKGMKLRVPPMKSFQMLADNVGYIGTPLPFSEAFTAVQTGVVDGVIGSGAEGYYASFRDVTKYYIPVNTHFEIWYLIINDELYQGLSDEQKAQLDAAASKFEESRWAVAEQDQKANEQRLADYGAQIVPVTQEQIDAHAAKVRETVWPVILKDVGAEWGQKVLDQIIQ